MGVGAEAQGVEDDDDERRTSTACSTSVLMPRREVERCYSGSIRVLPGGGSAPTGSSIGSVRL
ncbi:MAG: hypothetical protein C4305_04805 [Thermoleophilia bacterium]